MNNDIDSLLAVIQRPEVQPHHITEERLRRALAERGQVVAESSLRNQLHRKAAAGEIRKLPEKLFDPITQHWVNVYESVKNGKAKPKQPKGASKTNRRAP